MIRHCFSLSQQQKVTQSKYLNDLGHAAVDQSDVDDIINAATTQGIYNLTLGLSDKEKQVMVAGKAHKASVITYGEAREGAMEAHNFSPSASITTTHSRNEKKQDVKSVTSEKTLAKSVYSVDMSKVTEDDTDEERNGSGEGCDNDKKPHANKMIAIEGMQLLVERKKTAMLFETESMNGSDYDNKNSTKDSKDEEEESGETEDSKEEDLEGEGSREEAEEVEGSKEWAKINKTMNANMALTIAQLNRSLEDKEGRSLDSDEESYNKEDMSIQMGDQDISLGDYDPEATEVLSGIFEAEHGQKYEEPANFLQALWNVAGPSVGSMLTQLDPIKTELKGDEAGVEPDFSQIDGQLIDFLIKEAGEDTDECINFIDSVIAKLDKYKEKEDTEMEITQSGAPEGRPEGDALTPKEGGTSLASKTHGTLPGAPEASTAEGAAKKTNTTMADGDKEGAQSMSTAQGE
jgi:hypothetical protein